MKPIRAYKIAAIRELVSLDRSDSRYRLTAVTGGATYYVDDDARCRTGTNRWYIEPDGTPVKRHHSKIPDVECGCGFYAFSTREQALDHVDVGFAVLLEVELSGKVLVAERGFRAEHQRVLSAVMTQTCESAVLGTYRFDAVLDSYLNRLAYTCEKRAKSRRLVRTRDVDLERVSERLGVPVSLYPGEHWPRIAPPPAHADCTARRRRT